MDLIRGVFSNSSSEIDSDAIEDRRPEPLPAKRLPPVQDDRVRRLVAEALGPHRTPARIEPPQPKRIPLTDSSDEEEIELATKESGEADSRHYTTYTPEDDRYHKKWIKCQEVSTVNGKRLKCQYRRRLDRHKAALKRGVRHTCVFTQTTGPLDQIVHNLVSAEAGAMWDAIVQFIGESDIAISTAASPGFRQVIRTAFHGGFERGVADPKGDVDRAFAAFCPSRSPGTIRKYVCRAADAERAGLEAVLRENRFAAMTMDGGQIRSLAIFVTNLVAAHLHCSFTAGIARIEKCHDHNTLRKYLEAQLGKHGAKDITVSVIVCDGASYQTKALNYQDSESLQAMNPEHPILSRLIYVPCLCHRLNNAYRCLTRTSRVFGGFVTSLRALAVFLRKRAQRRKLGLVCPLHIITRWLYDFQILDFVLNNEAGINAIGDRTHRVKPIFRPLFDLLRVWFALVTQLEASDCCLSSAYPTIRSATTELAQIRDQCTDEAIRGVYDLSIKVIEEYTIASTYDLIQLAYVLTPEGRKEAFAQMHTERNVGIRQQPVLILELVDFDGQLAAHEEEIIPEDELQTSEEEEENSEASDGDSPDVVETEVTSLTIPSCRFASSQIAKRAINGLNRILDQFHLGDEVTLDVQRAFNDYLTSSDAHLGVVAAPDNRRFCWLSAAVERPGYAMLSGIALRLEPALCSEAPSERTIGQQRRFLEQHRTRTDTDLLSARTTLEDRRNQARRSHPVSRPDEPV
jgi:hypothetical protein